MLAQVLPFPFSPSTAPSRMTTFEQPDEGEAELVERVAAIAHHEALLLGRQRFFARVAEASGKRGAGELARELATHLRESWVRDNVERGLDLFHGCVDDTSERCVASLVAEYLGWREPPDAFFHRAGSLLSRRTASELVRLAKIVAAYARLPKPSEHELRLLAAVPSEALGDLRGPNPALAVLGFLRDATIGAAAAPRESLRVGVELGSLGNETLVVALATAEFAWLAEPGPVAVPLVGRPLLWFPHALDADLRRLHLIFASAIRG